MLVIFEWEHQRCYKVLNEGEKIQVFIPSGQWGILRVTLRRWQGVNVQMQDWKSVVSLSHAAERISPQGPFMPNRHRKAEK